MHKCFSNTGEPKREELTGIQGSRECGELCSPDQGVEAADLSLATCLRVFMLLCLLLGSVQPLPRLAHFSSSSVLK